MKAYDPEAMENVKGILGDSIEFSNSAYDATDGADALMIFTEWPVFRTPDFDRLESGLKNKAIFDGRNLYNPEFLEKLGFTYISIGRKQIG